MAIRGNILTPEVRANGYGGVEFERFEQAIDQIGLAHKFKAKPSVADIFDLSFLPPSWRTMGSLISERRYRFGSEADISHCNRHVRFTPQKRTCAEQLGMSAKG